jgi:uncharacterized protein YneF (UPF0154 family)
METMLVGIVIGLIIGVITGLFWGRTVIKSQTASSQPSEPSYLEVLRVLIGGKSNSTDYLGEMVKAMISRKRGQNITTSRSLLRLEENLLRDLERNFGLKPLVSLRLNSEDQWVEHYDHQKHESFDMVNEGDPVYIKEPGWQVRSPDGDVIILKKSLVQKKG